MLGSRFALSQLPVLAATLLLASPGYCGEAQPDPSITTYGTVNPAAPRELGQFAFLVGKWTGTGKNRDAAGKYTEYRLVWIGRYILDGMAIADEMRSPDIQGGAVQGITFRFFDAASKTWTVEFLNFGGSFLRKQVNAGVGAVTQDGKRVTIAQPSREGAQARELYTVTDPDHFRYSFDVSQDGKTWDEGLVVLELTRDK